MRRHDIRRDVLIHSNAAFPLEPESLGGALRSFVAFLRRHIIAADHAEFSVSLAESGCAGNLLLARAVPSGTKEFSVQRLSTAAGLTAEQFIAEAAAKKIKHSRSQLRIPASALPDGLQLLDDLAGELPDSGRGIMLLAYLTGWQFRERLTGTAVDVTFSRFRVNSTQTGATLNLRFHALSLKDPVVVENIAAASGKLGLRFGKPMAAFAASANQTFAAQVPPVSDARLEPPPAERQLIVLQTFDEALARAAERCGVTHADLEKIPFLFSRFEGSGKRIHDVMAGRKERINLPAELKRMMKAQFAEYRFGGADAEQLWFRKSIAPSLDLLLMFDRIHQWGLGKTFSVEFGADFPNTPFGGMHTGAGGTRKNIFWMFHEAWSKQVWTYSTSDELASALAGCAEFLARVLPALERECRALLLPVPAALPAGIEERGALSAREAYEVVLPPAKQWAADCALESVGSTNVLLTRTSLPDSLRSSIREDGRLRTQGSWSFKWVSARRDGFCHFTVPHTGRVWWNYYPMPQSMVAQPENLTLAPDWVDSTRIAEPAYAAIARELCGRAVFDIMLTLQRSRRTDARMLWEAMCISYGPSPADRQDVTVRLDGRSGEVVAVEKRG